MFLRSVRSDLDTPADVAELVDALVSGTSGGNIVGVQVSPSALICRKPKLLPAAMIVLKISNASEVVASKVGKFLEMLTPDSIDHATVEDQVIKKLIENLAAEGIKGEIAAINGLELDGENLSVQKGLNVRKHSAF